MDHERLATYRCEFEHTGQGDDILRNWIVVPIKGRMGRRLLEKDGARCNQFTFTDAATHHMRIPVGAGEKTVSTDHLPISFLTFDEAVRRLWTLPLLAAGRHCRGLIRPPSRSAPAGTRPYSR